MTAGRRDQLAEARTVCWQYQDWRGDRFIFSCECAGDGCPDDPRRAAALRVTTDGPDVAHDAP